MWRYIFGVPKVVEQEKIGEKTKAARDSKEYENNRTRKFSTKWQVGQSWLHHDHDGVGEGDKLLAE